MRSPSAPASLSDIAKEWGRIGCIGFGGPPAHIAALRELGVERRAWISADDRPGALIGGLGFIFPGLLVTSF
jgi:chromate transport protein ChrA